MSWAFAASWFTAGDESITMIKAPVSPFRVLRRDPWSKKNSTGSKSRIKFTHGARYLKKGQRHLLQEKWWSINLWPIINTYFPLSRCRRYSGSAEAVITAGWPGRPRCAHWKIRSWKSKCLKSGTAQRRNKDHHVFTSNCFARATNPVVLVLPGLCKKWALPAIFVAIGS